MLKSTRLAQTRLHPVRCRGWWERGEGGILSRVCASRYLQSKSCCANHDGPAQCRVLEMTTSPLARQCHTALMITLRISADILLDRCNRRIVEHVPCAPLGTCGLLKVRNGSIVNRVTASPRQSVVPPSSEVRAELK